MRTLVSLELNEKILKFYQSQQAIAETINEEHKIQDFGADFWWGPRGIHHQVNPSQGNQPEESPIQIWDASRSPIKIVKDRTGEKNPDNDAKAAFQNAVKTDDFFRRNLDGLQAVQVNNGLMNIYVHFGGGKNNASWHDETASVYIGDVNPLVYNPIVLNQEILTHEFGHAVSYYSAGLKYQGESGALDESISDVFGITHKHRLNNTQANAPDTSWLIGEKIIKNDKKTGAFRSLSHPGEAFDHPILGKDPQPKHMNNFVKTSKDHGGVHTNSGIPNHAFYLAAYSMGGNSWEKPLKIWHKALTLSCKRENFSGFARKTIAIARKDYDGNIENLVGQAWDRVGVDLRHPLIQTFTYENTLSMTAAIAMYTLISQEKTSSPSHALVAGALMAGAAKVLTKGTTKIIDYFWK